MPSQQYNHGALQCHRRVSTISLLAAFLATITLGPTAVLADDDITPGVEIPSDHGPANTPIIGGTFTSSFSNITQGQTLNLTWTNIDSKYEPLSITARSINRTSDGRGNGFLVNIAPQLYNTSSFSWQIVPYPLTYMSTGLYEIEIRPAIWNLSSNEPGSLTVPLLARSSFFSIIGQTGSSGNNNGGSTGNAHGSGQFGQSTTGSITSTKSSRPHHLELALGLSLGLTTALVLAAVAFFARRRHQRKTSQDEKQRQKQLAELSE
ncbi:hypothetical protein SEUCBS139899_000271 [Sporothrix eucalyptigena]|uniref:Uncharacterized protein n=1 Tax=Sporothrix eucalyptigena TaxID=1812306 RepID=A0ABP0CUC5_9PEZI